MFYDNYKKTSLKYLFFAIAGLCLGSLVALIAFSSVAFNGGNQHYIFYNPMTPSMICLTFFVTSLFFCGWLVIYPTSLTKRAAVAWLIMGLFYALFGFMALVAYSTMPNDTASALTSLFWLLGGSIMVYISYTLRTHGPPNPPQKRCCSLRNCCNTASVCFLVAFAMFTAAVTVQSIGGALDLKKYPPPGTIQTIQLDGKSIQVHLYCYGTKSNATWIFQHGGGANSVSWRAVADGISAAGNRVCVFDRLGYGWTPSYVTVTDSTQFSNGSVVLLKTLEKAGETGPFKCVGHSAGAAECLKLAISTNQVTSMAYVDGYPDYVTAGGSNGGAPEAIVAIISYLAGPTGFTRGLVGKPDAYFTPSNLGETSAALYAQTRFWFSQYWDVKSAALSGDGTLYQKLNGQKVGKFFKYGSNLNVKMAVYPAWATVTILDCTQSKYQSNYCCQNKDSLDCTAARRDYLTQAQFFANSTAVSPDTTNGS